MRQVINSRGTILDLCGGTGLWSKPYHEARYNVVVVTLGPALYRAHGGLWVYEDVREFDVTPYLPVRGILAAPPCTEFAIAGARHWRRKLQTPMLLCEALSIVEGCLRVIQESHPLWWALENPEGRLRRFLGPPRMTFDPSEFGERYNKKTLCWGNFCFPKKRKKKRFEGNFVNSFSGGVPFRSDWRSLTSSRFAREFFKVNR